MKRLYLLVRKVGSDSERATILAELQERLAQFRPEFAGRVPRDLRAARLEALRQGVTPRKVYRTCGVSKSSAG